MLVDLSWVGLGVGVRAVTPGSTEERVKAAVVASKPYCSRSSIAPGLEGGRVCSSSSRKRWASQ